MIEQALELARPSIKKILQNGQLIWGPRAVHICVKVPDLGPCDFDVKFNKLWNLKWGNWQDFVNIARKKLEVVCREKKPTSEVVATCPWLLKKGEYLYSGGAIRNEIAVSASGATGRADEAISEIVISMIIMLAHLETDERITNDKKKI
jgi:hypothetical protein